MTRPICLLFGMLSGSIGATAIMHEHDDWSAFGAFAALAIALVTIIGIGVDIQNSNTSEGSNGD